MWQDWVNGIVGVWIILMPFLGFDPGLHQTLMIISGIVVAVLGFWSAMGKSKSGMSM
ncbi:MAG: hypothetical protein AAB474_01020 [Patescibacteria group bacterium]